MALNSYDDPSFFVKFENGASATHGKTATPDESRRESRKIKIFCDSQQRVRVELLLNSVNCTNRSWCGWPSHENISRNEEADKLISER